MNLQLIPFLIRPNLYPYESLSSYLLRLSMENFHKSPANFRDYLDLTYHELMNNDISMKSVEKIASLSQKSPEDLYRRSSHYHCNEGGAKTSKQLINKSNIKFCPLCIEKNLYHKWPWCFNFINVCLEHSILMSNCCLNCHSPVTLNCVMSNSCRKCEMPISQGKPFFIKVDSLIYKSQSYFQDRLISKALQGNEWLNRISLSDLNELVLVTVKILKGLPRFHDYPTNPNGLNTDTPLYEQTLALANVYWMFDEFPKNFYAVFDVFLAKVPNDKKKQRRVKAFEQLVSKKELIPLHTHYLHCKKRINKKYIMEQEGVTNYQLGLLLNKGVYKPKGNNKEYSLTRTEHSSLIKMKNASKKYMSKKQASLLLGMNHMLLKKCLEEGILSEHHLPNYKSTFIKKAEADRLMGNLTFEVIQDVKEKMPFSCLLEMYKSRYGIGLAMKALFNNEGKVYSCVLAPKLTDLYFDHRSIEMDFLFIGANEVKKILKMEYDTVGKLVSSHLLCPIKIVSLKSGKQAMVFRYKDILHFKSEYMSVRRAADELKIDESIIRCLLKRNEIKDYFKGTINRVAVKRSELCIILGESY
nr:TniQ family protein [Metabacillus idriensis]